MNDQQFDLDAIEARANAATPGPWTVSEDYSDILTPDGSQLASYWNPTSETRNGEFIAHARQDVPALLAEVRRLRARVTELEGEQRHCGRTRGVDGNDHPPCALRPGHRQAYCRSADGNRYFLAVAADQPAASEEQQ